MRWWVWIGLAVGTAGCVKNTPAPEVATSLATPALDLPWALTDYQTAARRVAEAGQADPADLPRLTGTNAGLFTKLTSLDDLDVAFDAPTDGDTYLAAIEQYGALSKAYLLAAEGGADLHQEAIVVLAAQVHINSTLIPTLISIMELDEAGLRADPTRLRGASQARYGLATMLEGLLSLPAAFPRPDIMQAAATIIDDVTPFLLEEESLRLAGLTAELLGDDVAPADRNRVVEGLTTSPERHWVVAAFEEQHRANAQELRQRFLAAQAAPRPVNYGDEEGGARYSHPSGLMSGVFPSPPAASTQVEPMEPTPMSIRVLQGDDPDKLVRSLVCFDPIVAVTAADWALETLTQISGGPPVPTVVDDRDALEARYESDGITVHAVAVPLDTAGCIAVAEYPSGVDGSARQQAYISSLRILPTRDP